MHTLAPDLLKWFRHHGRHDLPWQRELTPYRVWISEIMLQQTQVKTVIPYYERFMQRFPDVHTLAAAPIDEVLHLWSGLGYYARARNLHKAASIIVEQYGGIFPEQLELVQELPGIGRSTAGAILALALNQVHPILDGNVKRVLTRYFGIHGWPGERVIEERLWQLAAEQTPKRDVAAYTQAIMDLGATVCTRSRPACDDCPLTGNCHAYQHEQQTSLPTRKPKKTIPVRESIFVIIENRNGEVLLQRRPPTGIWGGLWSLPECPPGEAVTAWLKHRFGSKVSQLTELEPLRHTFSHFHLDIRPYRARLNTVDVAVRDGDTMCWFRRDGDIRLGMAAPVLGLLSTLD